MNRRCCLSIRNKQCILPTLVGVVISLCAEGCIYLPTPEHGSHRITNETVKSIQIGKTHREDILLTFAEPAKSTYGDRIFVYEWTATKGYAVALVPVYPGCCIAGSVGLLRAFCVSFDSNGIVNDTAWFEEPFFDTRETYKESIDKWIGAHDPH